MRIVQMCGSFCKTRYAALSTTIALLLLLLSYDDIDVN
jgi:hypothetical protein